MREKTLILVFLQMIVKQSVCDTCLPFKNSEERVEVTKEVGTADITVDWTGSIHEGDWIFFDYVQIYQNGTPQKRLNKEENSEHSESTVNKITFPGWDICKEFSFEAKFFEEGSNCEKFSVTTKYDPVDFFDFTSEPEGELGTAGNMTTFTVFPKTNIGMLLKLF